MHCPDCQTAVAASFWKFPARKTACAACHTPLTLALPAGSRLVYYTLVFLFAFLFLSFLYFGIVIVLGSGVLPPPWPPAPAWFASAFIFMLLGRWLIGLYVTHRGRYLRAEQAPAGWLAALTGLPYALFGLLAGGILALPVFSIWGFNKQVTLLLAARCGGIERTSAQSELCMKMASYALMAGADPNFGYRDDTADGAIFPTPLNMALMSENWGMVNLLLDQGADVNSDRDGELPIFGALYQPEVFRLLLEHGARTDFIDRNGRNVLWRASFFNDKDVILQLIESGNDPNRPDKNGVTPFLIGCRFWDAPLIETVIRRGADIHHRDPQGLTAVHQAAKNKDARVLPLLAQKGLALDPETTDGRTPLWMAVVQGRLKNVRFLLERGVRVNVTNRAGRTPLHRGVAEGRGPVVRLLLEHGAHPNAADKTGWTPLHQAVQGIYNYAKRQREWDPELVSLLLHYKANVHARAVSPEKRPAAAAKDAALSPAPPPDWTPLHEAAQNGFVKGAYLLLEAGADPNVMTLDHRTPLSLAEAHRHLELVALLKARGALEGFGARQRP